MLPKEFKFLREDGVDQADTKSRLVYEQFLPFNDKNHSNESLLTTTVFQSRVCRCFTSEKEGINVTNCSNCPLDIPELELQLLNHLPDQFHFFEFNARSWSSTVILRIKPSS